MDTRLFILSNKDLSGADYTKFNIKQMCTLYKKYNIETIIIGSSPKMYSDIYEKSNFELPTYSDFIKTLKVLKGTSKQKLKDEYPKYFL